MSLGVFTDLQVSISMDKDSAEPGDSIRIVVKADAQSFVGLLAVDQSVLLLKSGNDITSDLVSIAAFIDDYSNQF